MSVELLKKACELYSQREVARRIGKSATTVNHILKGIYPKPEPILKTVSEVFADLADEEIVCPVLGKIHGDVCQRYKEWAKLDKVHKDRLYMQVKESCKNCTRGKR
ncbi:MAG: helix-turn-helix transcriptional regulator [Campylobacterales bacterium]|nr:helix-turn-helix transcriptional regulator [Campylobacterales bacterium]